MNATKWVIRIVMLSIVLLFTGFVEGYLVDYGVVNPVVGGMTLPFVTAAIVLILIWLLEKKAKVEVA